MSIMLTKIVKNLDFIGTFLKLLFFKTSDWMLINKGFPQLD